MSSPLLPVVLGLHLCQSGDRPVEGKHLLVSRKDGGVQGVLVVSLDAQVVDEKCVLVQLFLERLNNTLSTKGQPKTWLPLARSSQTLDETRPRCQA